MSPSVAGSAQSSSVTAITSSPASSASWAAAALSTPPLMATRVRRSFGSSRARPARAAWPSARCRASAVSSAAWRFRRASVRRARSRCRRCSIRAASRNGPPSTSSTVALAAAVSAPQPSASKPASTIARPRCAPRCARGHRRRRRRRRRCGASRRGRPTREARRDVPANDSLKRSYGAEHTRGDIAWREPAIECRRWPQPAVVGSGSWACCRSKSGCPPGRTTVLPRVGLPYRWYSAQHVRPTGEQARA